MFTYILSDKRKSRAFVAENLQPDEVMSLLVDALAHIPAREFSYYTFIILNEDDGNSLQLNGGEFLE